VESGRHIDLNMSLEYAPLSLFGARKVMHTLHIFQEQVSPRHRVPLHNLCKSPPSITSGRAPLFILALTVSALGSASKTQFPLLSGAFASIHLGLRSVLAWTHYSTGLLLIGSSFTTLEEELEC